MTDKIDEMKTDSGSDQSTPAGQRSAPVTSWLKPLSVLIFRAIGGRSGSPGGESQSMIADFRLLVSSDLAPETPFCNYSQETSVLGNDGCDSINSPDLPLSVPSLCRLTSDVLPTQEPFGAMYGTLLALFALYRISDWILSIEWMDVLCCKWLGRFFWKVLCP
jgi:hypothetical protein